MANIGIELGRMPTPGQAKNQILRFDLQAHQAARLRNQEPENDFRSYQFCLRDLRMAAERTLRGRHPCFYLEVTRTSETVILRPRYGRLAGGRGIQGLSAGGQARDHEKHEPDPDESAYDRKNKELHQTAWPLCPVGIPVEQKASPAEICETNPCHKHRKLHPDFGLPAFGLKQQAHSGARGDEEDKNNNGQHDIAAR